MDESTHQNETQNYTPGTPPEFGQTGGQTDQRANKAVIGMIMGIFDLVAWLIPIIGLPVGVAALILSIKGRNSTKHTHAIVGIVTAIIGLVLGVANAAIGAYMGATGQL